MVIEKNREDDEITVRDDITIPEILRILLYGEKSLLKRKIINDAGLSESDDQELINKAIDAYYEEFLEKKIKKINNIGSIYIGVGDEVIYELMKRFEIEKISEIRRDYLAYMELIDIFENL